MKPRLTDAEFEELKRKRDEGIARVVAAVCVEQGWDQTGVHVHASHGTGTCYCACPDGPCQHVWDGEPWTDENYWSVTCLRCGEVGMFHGYEVRAVTNSASSPGRAPREIAEEIADRIAREADRERHNLGMYGAVYADAVDAIERAIIAERAKPASEEVETMVRRLTHFAEALAEEQPHESRLVVRAINDAAALLRRLAPRQSEGKLSYDASIADLQTEIGRLQGILHRRVLGDPRESVSAQARQS